MRSSLVLLSEQWFQMCFCCLLCPNGNLFNQDRIGMRTDFSPFVCTCRSVQRRMLLWSDSRHTLCISVCVCRDAVVRRIKESVHFDSLHLNRSWRVLKETGFDFSILYCSCRNAGVSRLQQISANTQQGQGTACCHCHTDFISTGEHVIPHNLSSLRVAFRDCSGTRLQADFLLRCSHIFLRMSLRLFLTCAPDQLETSTASVPRACLALL